MKDTQIIIVVEGGVIQQVCFGDKVAKDISVLIRDFDCDSVEESQLGTDYDGNPCIVSEWFPDGSISDGFVIIPFGT